MKITLLSDADSWINPRIKQLAAMLLDLGHTVTHVHTPNELVAGDLCFILSCSSLISAEKLALHRHNLVVHESKLPQGKGWSPLTWQIIEGKAEIPITLFEAVAERVDAGKVYLQKTMKFAGHELVDDLRAMQAAATIELCREFVMKYPEIVKAGINQHGDSSYYRRRKPSDSEIDPRKSILEQFNVLRTVDNDKYPAFFDHMGQRYYLRITKAEGGKT